MSSTAGHGVSLKAAHYGELLQTPYAADWAEALTENFLGRGGRPPAVLEHVRRDAELILHGVSMSLGGCDPFDPEYFRSLRTLADRYAARFVSDHLCFGSVGGHQAHDLWPLPMTEGVLRHVVARVRQAQERLGRTLVIENVSAYVGYHESEMTEAAFFAELLAEADAMMLLDVNNVYVSAHNFGFDPYAYLAQLPQDRIAYIHLAGHADCGDYLLDDHGAEVCDGVWGLYRAAIARFGPTPTIVEWDSNLPSLPRLLAESARAQEQARRALSAVPVSAGVRATG